MNSLEYSALLAPAAITFLAYLASLVMYRLLFHPLAKFPGPRLAAATRLYEAYYDVILGGRYTHKIARLHEKYGPIVRISPHELHIHDPDYYDTFYREDALRDKYAWSYHAFGSQGAVLLTTAHEVHKMRRVAPTSFFSKPAVNARSDLIQTTADRLGERIDGYADSGAVLNLGAAYSALTQDIATEFIVGESNRNLDRDDFNEDGSVMLQSSGALWRLTKHIRLLGSMPQTLPLSLMEKIGSTKMAGLMKYRTKLQTQVRDLMNAHVAGQRFINARPTLVDAILSSKGLRDEDKLYERVADDILVITNAGFETTAAALRMISYHVYSNSEILAELRAEILGLTNTLAPGEKPTWTQLSQLPYLTAVILEGLRFSPGLVTRMARVAHQEIRYKDWIIPADTPVGMTTILMHKDESIYKNPEKFDPQRFVDQEERWRLEKYYAPFSKGSRNCLGMHLAWAELYITLAAVVPRFDFEFTGTGREDVEFHTDQFIMGLKGQNGVKVIARRREV